MVLSGMVLYQEASGDVSFGVVSGSEWWCLEWSCIRKRVVMSGLVLYQEASGDVWNGVVSGSEW